MALRKNALCNCSSRWGTQACVPSNNCVVKFKKKYCHHQQTIFTKLCLWKHCSSKGYGLIILQILLKSEVSVLRTRHSLLLVYWALIYIVEVTKSNCDMFSILLNRLTLKTISVVIQQKRQNDQQQQKKVDRLKSSPRNMKVFCKDQHHSAALQWSRPFPVPSQLQWSRPFPVPSQLQWSRPFPVPSQLHWGRPFPVAATLQWIIHFKFQQLYSGLYHFKFQQLYSGSGHFQFQQFYSE